MIMALLQRTNLNQVEMWRVSGVLSNKWMVLVVAALVWAVYFYTMDWMLMEAQGLPVQMSLMPR